MILALLAIGVLAMVAADIRRELARVRRRDEDLNRAWDELGGR